MFIFVFGFPGNSDDIIVINYCIPYANYYIYLEKLKEYNKTNGFNVDFPGCLCHLKYTLNIKNYLKQKIQIDTFEKFNIVFGNLYVTRPL